MFLTDNELRQLAGKRRRDHLVDAAGKAMSRCYRRFKVLPLDQLRGLPAALPSTARSGVYFLWFGPELVYIGKSVCIGDRIFYHRVMHKEFTHATFERGHPECIRELEGDYVLRYRPLLNLTSSG
jgi:hypothetical protein